MLLVLVHEFYGEKENGKIPKIWINPEGIIYFKKSIQRINTTRVLGYKYSDDSQDERKSEGTPSISSALKPKTTKNSTPRISPRRQLQTLRT